MTTPAPLALAGFTLAACNVPAPQAMSPPAPASVAVTPPGFQLPEGADCSAKIARYRAVQDNDPSMGQVVQSVYNQIKRETDAASKVCAAGRDAEAKSMVAASGGVTVIRPTFERTHRANRRRRRSALAFRRCRMGRVRYACAKTRRGDPQPDRLRCAP